MVREKAEEASDRVNESQGPALAFTRDSLAGEPAAERPGGLNLDITEPTDGPPLEEKPPTVQV
ncbi:MAG: hypothetical protein K6U08_06620, partial [Firmicutes bacterium]|nr:hypothetical protein [Bacillota bacterium]